MKTFITGYKGFVGKELVKRGFIPLVCDVTNPEEVDLAISKQRPDLLIHLASRSDIDFCEDIKNHDTVVNVNVKGVRNVFESLERNRLPGVFVSSDHIWRGGFFEKHAEDSKLTPSVNFYGSTKLVAEQIVKIKGGKIIRTSYLFNAERLAKRVQCIKAGLKQDYPVFIKRSFLHVLDFCDALENYCNHFHKLPQTLHLAGSASVSWYRFMKEVERQYGGKNSVTPRFFEKQGCAPRSHFGGLDVTKALELGFTKKDYIDGIKRMIYEG